MRPDGARVKNLPPIVAAIPYIMPKRYDAQRIQKDFYCLCNALADTHALSERSDDLMRICLFELVIVYILTYKIMYIFLFFPFGYVFRRTHKLFNSGFHCFLMLFYFAFIKQIFRNKNNIR